MNSLTIIVLLIFLACIIIGYRRGLFRSVLGIIATVVAIILAYVLTPIVSQIIINNTKVDDYIDHKIYSYIEEKVRESAEKKLEESGVPKEMAKISDSQLADIMSQSMSKAAQVELIKNLGLPGEIKTSLIDNNHDEIYNKLNVDNIYRYMSRYITYMIINFISSIITFVIIRLLLIILTIALNATAKRIPLVSSVNRIGGMIFGGIAAIIISWLILLVASFVFGIEAENMIRESILLTKIQEHNVFITIITNITDILF